MKKIFLFLGVFLVLAGCSKQPVVNESGLLRVTLLGLQQQKVSLSVEVADEPEEQSQGLMFREKVPNGTGMLFTYSEPRVMSFWMKNTLVPLDILFFDADGSFVSSKTMDPCKADPCPSYSSDSPAQYALEVPSGFLDQFDVGEGWKLLLDE